MRVFAFLPMALAIVALATACSSDDSGTICQATLEDGDCTPQYAPTWDNIFVNSITPSCAPPGTACHAAEGARAGLILEDIDQSYDLLTGGGNDVIAGDGCGSELGDRVTRTDPSGQMPPGAPLTAGEQCAILQWIENGAQR